MPFPGLFLPIGYFLAWLFGGVAVGTVGLVALGAILEYWEGKRIAILGPRGVGKTALAKFLEDETITEQYNPNARAETRKCRTLALKDLKIEIEESYDVHGTDEAYDVWKKLTQKADVVFYLFRTDKLIKGDADTEKRLLKDMKHIIDWLSERDPRPDLFLIGTHCDRVREYHRKKPEAKVAYLESFMKRPDIRNLVRRADGAKHVTVLLGITNTQEEIESLVYNIFKKVLQDG